MRNTSRLSKKSLWKDTASWELLLLCVPAIVGYILFNYIPMVASVIIPFKDYKFNLGILGSEWAGLKNFKWILTSTSMARVIRNTLGYGIWFMILEPVTNVILALLLFEVGSRRALKTYQTIITFPNFMSMVIVGYITYAVLSPTTGMLNNILQLFGKQSTDYYMNSNAWPVILSIVNLWKGIGMGSMMYFAALMGVDPALYEAAEIDGANRLHKMWHISMPYLIPLICIFTILSAGRLFSSNFDLFYIIPRNSKILYSSTDILSTYVYRALADGNYAMGSSVGLIQSLVGLILIVVTNFIVKNMSADNSLF